MLSRFSKQDDSTSDAKLPMQLSFMDKIIITVGSKEMHAAALTFPNFKPLQLPSFVQAKFAHPFVLPALSLCVPPFRQGATLVTETRVQPGQIVTYYNGIVSSGYPTNADFVFENISYPQPDAQQIIMRGILDCNKANFCCFVKGFESIQKVIENAQCGGLGQFIQSVNMQDKGNVALKVMCFTTQGIIKNSSKLEAAIKKCFELKIATSERLDDNMVYILPFFEAKTTLEPGTPLTCAHKFREDQELKTTESLAHVYYLKKSDDCAPYEFPLLPMNCKDVQLYENVFATPHCKVEDMSKVSLKKWLQKTCQTREEETSKDVESSNTEKRGREEEAEDEGPVYHQSFIFQHDDPRFVTGVFGTGEGQINIPGAGFDTLTSDFTLPEDGYETSDCSAAYATSSDDQAEEFTDEWSEQSKLYPKEPVAPAPQSKA